MLSKGDGQKMFLANFMSAINVLIVIIAERLRRKILPAMTSVVILTLKNSQRRKKN